MFKLNTISLQCMEWMLKYELPSLKSDIKDITKSLFAILHKYASAGLKKGDNFDLVMASFKVNFNFYIFKFDFNVFNILLIIDNGCVSKGCKIPCDTNRAIKSSTVICRARFVQSRTSSDSFRSSESDNSTQVNCA